MAPGGPSNDSHSMWGRLFEPASRRFRGRGWLVLLVVVVPLALAVWVTRRFSSGLHTIDVVGKPVPAFSLSATGGGKPVSSGELADGRQWNILVFWTTSCVECRSEAPEIRRFVENPQKSIPPTRVLSINIGDPEPDVVRWLGDVGLSSGSLLDSTQQVAHAFGVTGVPEAFFVDPSGVVRHRSVGGLSTEEMVRIVEVLAEPGTGRP